MRSKPAEGPALSTRRLLGMAGVIVLLTFIAYVPAMRAGFAWDDDDFLTKNAIIHASDGLYRFWFTTEPPDYFPLVSSSLWVEWRLWGMNATGYHVVNVLLHAVSAVLVWRVLTRLRIPGAWLAGLIFAVHPVCVESVAWITERKNTLPMVFYLLSILFYLKSDEMKDGRGYAVSLGFFLLALLSKTSVVMLPFVLLGCAWWQRGRIGRRDVLRTIPFLLLGLGFGLLTIWFQYNRAIGPEVVVRTDGFPGRLAAAGCAVWFYLYKAVLPFNLAFVYPRWQIDASSILSYIPGLTLVGCFALFGAYRKAWGRPFVAGLGYYVITLLPVLGFLDIYFMRYSLVADHWQYTSIVGVIALGIGLAAGLAQRRRDILRGPATAAAAVLVGLFGVLTWRQASIYTNPETLWRDTLAKAPRSSMPHSNLGALLIERGKTDEALEHFHEALRISPDEPEAHHDLASALTGQDKLDEAITHYTEALRLRPTYTKAECNLANALARQGKLEEALAHYDAALRLKPTYALAHNNLAQLLAGQGRLDEAIGHYSEALQADPAYAEAHHNLANALAGQGRLDEAIAHYIEALRLKPSDAIAHYNLATTLTRRGRLDEAASHYTEALRLDPAYAEAHNNLALTLARQGKLDEAAAHYRSAIRLKSRFAEAHKGLGAVLERQGKVALALQEYQEALRLNPQDNDLRGRLERILGPHAQSRPS